MPSIHTYPALSDYLPSYLRAKTLWYMPTSRCFHFQLSYLLFPEWKLLGMVTPRYYPATCFYDTVESADTPGADSSFTPLSTRSQHLGTASYVRFRQASPAQDYKECRHLECFSPVDIRTLLTQRQNPGSANTCAPRFCLSSDDCREGGKKAGLKKSKLTLPAILP